MNVQGNGLASLTRKTLKSLLRTTSLWCAGRLGNCPTTVSRFRFTCLWCRWRREWYGKFEKPPFWIEYTYACPVCVRLMKSVERRGLLFTAPHGRMLKVTVHRTLKIDPRGHLTSLRCAVVMVLDKVMKRLGYVKPFVEFCELFANYPTW